jgi:sulfur-carrier protein adenylyltransferase/sulfurtransferase
MAASTNRPLSNTPPHRDHDARSSGPFSSDELQRYSRHLVLPGVGEAGQQRLREGRVLLVGAGGLGSPAALYLAAAGVGCIGVVDADRVDVSNLQRQVLYGSGSVGQPKVNAASARLRDLNPHVRVNVHQLRLTSANALDVLGDYDVIVDGTDNFPTRYLVNDACILLGKPNVYGSVLRFEGQASVFGMPDGPCYRCLFREPPPPELATNCEEGGVFGVLPGLIGVIQATETIKLLLGSGESLSGRLLLVDALRMRFHTIALARDPQCPACGTRELTALVDYEVFCGVRNSAQRDAAAEEISVGELHARLKAGNAPQLIDVREPWEWNIARLPEARLLPMASIPTSLDKLDSSKELIIYCHHGVRSAQVMHFLRESGFANARSLAGGIDRWSIEVDSTLPRY